MAGSLELGGGSGAPGTSLRGPLSIRPAPGAYATKFGGASGTVDVDVFDANAILQQQGTAVFDANGHLIEGAALAVSSPNPVGFSGIRVAKAIYDFAIDGGAISTITPSQNVTLPANAIMVGGFAKAGAAITGTAGLTIAIGTAAGSSTTALLTASGGALANWAADAILALVPTLAAPVELTAAGKVTITIGTHAVTAGQIEIFVFFLVPLYA